MLYTVISINKSKYKKAPNYVLKINVNSIHFYDFKKKKIHLLLEKLLLKNLSISIVILLFLVFLRLLITPNKTFGSFLLYKFVKTNSKQNVMCESVMLNFIDVDENSRVPKYIQIINSIIHNISVGNITAGDKIPSINLMSEEYYLSRDTVARAYNILKERKVIESVQGKGNYITRTKLISKINILFLVNKLSSYKMKIYNSFLNNIGANAHTDIHIYHCDELLFLELMNKYKSAYDYYVIMPHFKTENLKHVSFTEKVNKVINDIAKEKLVILDNVHHGVEGDFIEIYQDFENDIYNALKSGYDKISKYKKLILVYPEKAVYPYPRRILHGFRKFCSHHNIDFEIFDEVYDDIILKVGDLFITIEEDDLVKLLKQIRDDEFVLGRDVGVISYNDTPLKELLGISVISTDFKIMGQTAANMIISKEKAKVKVPFDFIHRNSI